LGQVVTCLTTVGFDWTNWPLEPGAYVPLQLEFAKRIARQRQALEVRVVGEPIPIDLDAGTYGPQVEVSPPDGTRIPVTLSLANAEGGAPAEGSAQVVRYAGEWKGTDEPGLYAIASRRQDGTDEVRRISVNVPASESRLETVASDALRKSLTGTNRVQVHDPGDVSWLRGEQSSSDLTDWVLLGLLILLAIELALSYRLSYHPTPVGARA
jgi:hypothetical protein